MIRVKQKYADKEKRKLDETKLLSNRTYKKGNLNWNIKNICENTMEVRKCLD